LGEPKSHNVGSESQLGESLVPRDHHFVHDYSRRRVPMPVIAYMAVADSEGEQPATENYARFALDRLAGLVQPPIIAEEELNKNHMEKLLGESLASVRGEVSRKAASDGVSGASVSVSVVLAGTSRAFIGHVGSTRVYLLHNERLYDLTPTGELSGGPIEDESLKLFSEATGQIGDGGTAAEGPGGVQGKEAPTVRTGYNEVDIVPGDTIVLCTDGLHGSVSEDEMVENLLTSLNIQRSASQLTRLASGRKPDDNATMAAWQYALPGETAGKTEREIRRERRKDRFSGALIISVLVLVLAAIFAVGFAFGWRITDSFRKPAKQSVEEPRQDPAPVEQEESDAEAEAEEQEAMNVATVSGEGVRMRKDPDVASEIVGLLRDGQQVAILGEVIGSDSKTWSKVRGVVRSQGEDIDGEGYVSNNFLTLPEDTIENSAPVQSAP
jgi:serine/threonine protein phosphatase PrpC